MPITITSAEINPNLHCVFGDNGLLKCRIGLISAEVIVMGFINPMPLFPSLFSQSYLLIFFPKGFCTCYYCISLVCKVLCYSNCRE